MLRAPGCSRAVLRPAAGFGDGDGLDGRDQFVRVTELSPRGRVIVKFSADLVRCVRTPLPVFNHLVRRDRVAAVEFLPAPDDRRAAAWWQATDDQSNGFLGRVRLPDGLGTGRPSDEVAPARKVHDERNIPRPFTTTPAEVQVLVAARGVELSEKRLSVSGFHQPDVHVLVMEQPLPRGLHDISLTRLGVIRSTRRICPIHVPILPPRASTELYSNQFT